MSINYTKQPKKIFALLKDTYKGWNANDPFRQSAVIAYYTIFSLPALVLILINVAGLILKDGQAQAQIMDQITGLVGADAAQQVQSMADNASNMGDSFFGIVVGVGTLLFGATGVFYQLQQSLNIAWEVQPRPDTGIKKLALDRATSLGVIIAIGFLLIIFMVVSTLLNSLSSWIQQFLPEPLFYVMYVINVLLPLGVITVLFAMIFKILPDAKIEWRSVWVGAFVTSLLFALGKFLLGFYFAESNPASSYGVAGSIILIMLWVNYSALIFLFGAEFTQVYARDRGHNIEPNSYAQRTPNFRLKQMEEDKKQPH